jgi:Flp pilus assembly protein TadD
LLEAVTMLEKLDRIRWHELSHAYGSAADVPACLRRLLADDAQRRAALRELRGNIYHQGDRYSATPAAIPFLFELALAPEVKDRAEILGFVTHLVAGDCCFRNGLTLNDGERVLFFGRELSGEQARAEAPRVWLECYQAAVAFVPELLELFAGSEPSLRLEAARLLGCFRTRASEIAPRLLERFDAEEFGDVRANVLFALHRLHGPAFDARLVLESMLPKLSAVCAAVAAMCLVQLCGAASSVAAVDTLKAGLEAALKYAEDEPFYAACRFGEGLAGDIGHAVARLPHERARGFLGALCRTLGGKVEMLATLGVTAGILRAGFSAPYAGGALTDSNRVAVAALLANDDVWTVANNGYTFRAYGLPQSRRNLGELAGLSPGDSERGKQLLKSGVTLAQEGKLVEARANFQGALELFPEEPLVWANAAWCTRSVGQPEQALDLVQRGSALFPDAVPVLNELTAGLFAAGRYAESEGAATRGVERDPRNAYFTYMRACAHVKLGNFDAAVADVARTIELDATQRKDIAADGDFAPIRERADFRRLVVAAS